MPFTPNKVRFCHDVYDDEVEEEDDENLVRYFFPNPNMNHMASGPNID